jgi:hypothetical protein
VSYKDYKDDSYNPYSQEYINPELRAYLRQQEEASKSTVPRETKPCTHISCTQNGCNCTQDENTPAAQPESLVEAAREILIWLEFYSLKPGSYGAVSIHDWEVKRKIGTLRRALATPQAGDGWVKV